MKSKWRRDWASVTGSTFRVPSTSRTAIARNEPIMLNNPVRSVLQDGKVQDHAPRVNRGSKDNRATY